TAKATYNLGLTNTSAPVQVTVVAPGGPLALYLRTDAVTQGTWLPVYGQNGYNVINDAANYPPFAQVTVSGQTSFTWASSTSDVRALQRANGSGRIAATWFNTSAFDITLNLTDGQPHD